MLPKKAFKLFPHGESSPFRRPRREGGYENFVAVSLPPQTPSPDKDSPTTPLKGGAALEMNRKFDDVHIHSISHKKWYFLKQPGMFFALYCGI